MIIVVDVVVGGLVVVVVVVVVVDVVAPGASVVLSAVSPSLEHAAKASPAAIRRHPRRIAGARFPTMEALWQHLVAADKKSI